MKIENLCVQFENKRVIDDLSFTLQRGQKVAVMGKSGEGKTTLLRAIAGLIPYGGKIEKESKCSFVFQTDKLIGELSAKENLLLVNPDCDAENLLRRMGLENKINAQVKNLSGGMCRRVAFARAFAYDTEIVLADEPFSGLDIATKYAIIEKTKELIEDKTLLLVTHDLFEARSLCTHSLIIEKGKVLKIFDHSRESEEEMLKFLRNL